MSADSRPQLTTIAELISTCGQEDGREAEFGQREREAGAENRPVNAGNESDRVLRDSFYTLNDYNHRR